MDIFETIEMLNDGGRRPPQEVIDDDSDDEDFLDLADVGQKGPIPSEDRQLLPGESASHVPDAPPLGWRSRPTPIETPVGPDWRPEPIVLLGQYLRRSRYFVELSQEALSRKSGVTQSMISRAERGRAPALRADRLGALGEALGRVFPLGFCPHDHDCAWQPAQSRTAPPRNLPEREWFVGTDWEVPARRRLLNGE